MEAWKDNPENKKKSKAGDDRTPAWRWTGYLYHDGEHLGVAEECVRRSMMDGATMIPVPGGRGSKTFKAQSQSGMFIEEMNIPIAVDGKTVPYSEIESLRSEENFYKHREKCKELGFQILCKRAKIGTSKHVRVRPMFSTWSLQFSLVVIDEQLTEPVLRDIITYAGQYKGLCDWRPGSPKSPGRYGMFALGEMKSV
jgi:hypothetical protein